MATGFDKFVYGEEESPEKKAMLAQIAKLNIKPTPKVEAPSAGAGAGGGAMAALGADSAASGAISGAMAGGPVGAMAGAALGLAQGLANQSKKRKAIEGAKHAQLGENAKQTAKDKNKAIESLMSGLRAAFLGQGQ